MLPNGSALLQPLRDFLRLEAAGGLLLMAAAVLALIVANSPATHYYSGLQELPLAISVGSLGISKPLILWVNDGLMSVFFFLIGLELKREILDGQLASARQIGLPAFAALGGMLLPAAIFALLNRHDPVALSGWAIPTATDIAFALGVMSLLGSRVPTALKIFLLGVAIFDDLGAILVIAVFYTSSLSFLSMGIAAALLLILACLNLSGVRSPAAYILVGLLLWFAVLNSGVHATLAGVLLALFIPLRPSGPSDSSPLRRLEAALHPWVAFGILPAFAFTNAGVDFRSFALADFLHPVPLGVMIGLVLGKPLGVLAMCWLGVQARAISLPDGVGWGQILGAALLCGIGFTMSLFIASLAYEHAATAFLGLERLGIMIGSLLSGLLGYLLLRKIPGRAAQAAQAIGGPAAVGRQSG